MTSEPETTRIIGLAKILRYEVTFEYVAYAISVRECLLETSDRAVNLPDYEIHMTIPFKEDGKVLHWVRNPAFTLMQESWKNKENDCYFEHCSTDKAALMSLNGTAVLIPVRNH